MTAALTPARRIRKAVHGLHVNATSVVDAQVACMALALSVAGDPTVDPAERAVARTRLTSTSLLDASVGHLTREQLYTLDALLDIVISGKPQDDTVLRVVAEPVPPKCYACTARQGDSIDVSDLDDVSREVVRDVIANLRNEDKESNTRLLGDGR